MKVIGYTRVSTDEQARSGLGLDAQRERIQQEAARRGWTVTWAEDEGYSAGSLDRPALTSALASLRSGEAGALVVAKLDRLSRSLLDFAGLMDRAQREAWAVITLDLGVDMTTPSGQLLANVMAAFAEYERALIRQRTRDALAALKRRGVRLGRPRALPGAVVGLVAGWRAAGATHAAMAEALNAAGVPTAHGGQRWYPSTVRAVLRSVRLDEEAVAAREAVTS